MLSVGLLSPFGEGEQAVNKRKASINVAKAAA